MRERTFLNDVRERVLGVIAAAEACLKGQWLRVISFSRLYCRRRRDNGPVKKGPNFLEKVNFFLTGFLRPERLVANYAHISGKTDYFLNLKKFQGTSHSLVLLGDFKHIHDTRVYIIVSKRYNIYNPSFQNC